MIFMFKVFNKDTLFVDLLRLSDANEMYYKKYHQHDIRVI